MPSKVITIQQAIDILYKRHAALLRETIKGYSAAIDYKRGMLSGLGQAIRLLEQVEVPQPHPVEAPQVDFEVGKVSEQGLGTV